MDTNNGWVQINKASPTLNDLDCNSEIWVFSHNAGKLISRMTLIQYKNWVTYLRETNKSHWGYYWKPTNLPNPEPPHV